MKRSLLCLFSMMIFTLSTSAALADPLPAPYFCMDYAATCGLWPDMVTTCDTWWESADVGAEGDTSGATQGCYTYHLGVAMTALADADTASMLAHCAHSIGGEDADGNAPCTDDEPVVDPPAPYDACDGKVCGDVCNKCDPAADDCVAEEGQFCDLESNCVGTGVDSPPNCDEVPVVDCDPACAEGEACVDGVCVADPVIDCDPVCVEGEICVDGACVADPGIDPGDGAFSINDCWNEQCVAETDACKAEPDCAAYNECYKSEDFECQTALTESNPDAVALHQAIRECGWQSCNDPSAGSCADAGKPAQDGTATDNRCGQWDDNWPCNCDDACTQFNDCCDDYSDICGGSTGGGGGDGGTGPCVPQCIGKSCGPDGCGDSCGACQTGQACTAAGVCEAACEDACALTDPATCLGDVANICGEGASGCLELITDDCAVEGLICAGEGVCIPGAGDGTDPETDGSLAGDDDDSDGSDAAGCAGGPASTGTPFMLLLVLALGALVRRRSLV